MRFPFVDADTSTRDNDLKCRFFGFADGRRLMDEWRFGLQWLFVFGRNQFLDLLTRRQDGPTGDR
jgi:hypothetical protein